MLRSPLFRRLFGAVATLALLPLIVTAAGAALLLRGEGRAATEARLRTDAVLAREAVRPLFASGDGAAIDALAKKLAREAQCRLTFIAGDGRVLGDSDADPRRMDAHGERPEVRDARERGAGSRIRFSDTVGEEMFYYAIRLDPADPRAGTVRAAVRMAAVRAELRQPYVRIALIAAPFGFAALASAWLALGVFSRAVHDLTAAAETVAAGGPSRRTDAEEREDEIGSLARAVHAMAGELSHRIQTIARERNELATIVGGLGEGLVAVDPQARILLFNGAARDLFGIPEAPRPGTPLSDAVPHGAVVTLARDALDAGTEIKRKIELFGAAGVEPRAVEARATPFGDEGGGRAAGVVVLLRDVTEAERYERLRRDFVANVSHELRTPLSLVKGFLETLEDGAIRDPERGPRFLEILRRHVLGLERLVADLLTLSALEAGADDRRPPGAVSLADAVDAVLSPFEEAFARKRLTVTRAVAADLPSVLALEDRVERAIRNLVDNAAKYTPEGGAIHIAGHAREGEVELSVKDTGPGIPNEEGARIFERFYRVDKSRSREAGGTGLGLAIVKHIMQQAGGAVSVKSEPGRGATFTLTFRPAPA